MRTNILVIDGQGGQLGSSLIREIIAPIGIVIADALLGEVTPSMAAAVGQADAVRILIPMNRCKNIVAGIGDLSMTELIGDALNRIESLLKTKE